MIVPEPADDSNDKRMSVLVDVDNIDDTVVANGGWICLAVQVSAPGARVLYLRALRAADHQNRGHTLFCLLEEGSSC